MKLTLMDLVATIISHTVAPYVGNGGIPLCTIVCFNREIEIIGAEFYGEHGYLVVPDDIVELLLELIQRFWKYRAASIASYPVLRLIELALLARQVICLADLFFLASAMFTRFFKACDSGKVIPGAVFLSV